MQLLNVYAYGMITVLLNLLFSFVFPINATLPSILSEVTAIKVGVWTKPQSGFSALSNKQLSCGLQMVLLIAQSFARD